MTTSNPNHDPEKCKALFARLSEYIDGELDETTRQKIARHMTDCLPCQACLLTLERTVALCHDGLDIDTPTWSASKIERLVRSITAKNAPA